MPSLYAARGSLVANDEIPLLEDRARHLDEEISRLNEDRAAILRRMNSTRSATGRLPPEVLSTIFQFVPPPFNFVPPFASYDFSTGVEPWISDDIFQLDVAAVCHAWRQAAISTPQFWTSLSLGIHPCFIRTKILLLDQFSQKVPHLPMSIELNFQQQLVAWPDDFELCLHFMAPIKNAVFFKHAGRIQRLRLYEPPSAWLPLLENLSRCDTLVVARPLNYEDQDSVDLTALPCLRHVVLIHPYSKFSLPRSTITTLHFYGVSCVNCMELLMHCPNLVEFESYSPALCRHNTGGPPNGPVTLEQIEYLTWSSSLCRCLPFIQRCIGHLRFSKLRALQWYNDKNCYPDAGGRDTRLDFFSNLPTTLSSLTFCRFIYRGQESILKVLLFSISQLRELCFTECSVKCVEAVINAIGRPIVPPSEKDQQPVLTFLPNLSKLSLKSLPKKLNGRRIVDMLGALRSSGKNPKDFQLEVDDSVSWNIISQKRLRSLVAFGFLVEGVSLNL